MTNNTREEIMKELGEVLTFQYDYPPTGEGWLGFKGHNMYRFKAADMDKINAFLESKSEEYMNEFNVHSLAQEIISDLLDEGLIEYGGYGYKASQKNTASI